MFSNLCAVVFYVQELPTIHCILQILTANCDFFFCVGLYCVMVLQDNEKINKNKTITGSKDHLINYLRNPVLTPVIDIVLSNGYTLVIEKSLLVAHRPNHCKMILLMSF